MKIKYKKYNIGDIIYPHYNGTAVWYRNNVWSVVVKINKKGYWKEIRHFECMDSAFVYSELLKLTALETKEKRK